MKNNWWIDGDSVVVLLLFAIASIVWEFCVGLLFSIEVRNLGVLCSLAIILLMKNKMVDLF